MPSRSIRDQRPPLEIPPAGITPPHATIAPPNPATPSSQTAKPLQPSMPDMGGPGVLSNPTPGSQPQPSVPGQSLTSGSALPSPMGR